MAWRLLSMSSVYFVEMLYFISLFCTHSPLLIRDFLTTTWSLFFDGATIVRKGSIVFNKAVTKKEDPLIIPILHSFTEKVCIPIYNNCNIRTIEYVLLNRFVNLRSDRWRKYHSNNLDSPSSSARLPAVSASQSRSSLL